MKKRYVLSQRGVAALFVSILLVHALGAHAEEPRSVMPEATRVVTHHTFMLDGERIAYTATAGTVILRDEETKPLASMFYVAYTREGVDDPAARPVTFSFSGGPGVAAIWPQIGAFGPKKVLAEPEGWPLPPPGRLVDNPHSLLDATDLVFIDPISTGFSRPAPGVDVKRFHGLKGDVESVGELIRLWLTQNGRWASPKFIAGESYGTTRAAGLVFELQERHGMYLDGVILMSSVLNWGDQEMNVGNDLPYALHLPSYTAAAWYHKKLPVELMGDLRQTLAEVERFALGEYASALLQGDWLDPVRRRQIAEKVARYTGVSVDFVERSRLRLDVFRFTKELLRAEGKTIGRFDTRFTGYDLDSAGEAFEFDPAGKAIDVGYVTSFNDYLRRHLGYETDLVYEPFKNVFPWKWDDFDNRYVNVAESLRGAITRNPRLHVLFISGYFDLATPYFDTPYTVAHLGLPEPLRSNVEIAFYEAGHMIYVRDVDHQKFKRDVADFIHVTRRAGRFAGAGRAPRP